jgi:enoyl-CoA hydratase/carnithine racemase
MSMSKQSWDALETLKVERKEAIVHIRLNRPSVANAINHTLEAELYRVLKDCDADPGVKCALVTAEGKNFSSGHDIREFAHEVVEGLEPKEINGRNWVRTGELLPPWWFTKALVIAAKGFVGPHANTLLLAADVVIAADNARFSWEETRVGIGAPFGPYALMPFHFPMRVVKHLWMWGGWMDAATAERLFYVNRVVPLGDEEMVAWRFAEQLSRMELEHLTVNKRGIHKVYEAAGLSAMVAVGRDPYVPQGSAQEALLHHLRLICEQGAGAAARARDADWDDDLSKV